VGEFGWAGWGEEWVGEGGCKEKPLTLTFTHPHPHPHPPTHTHTLTPSHPQFGLESMVEHIPIRNLII